MTSDDAVTITLRLFAVYRERVGADCLELALPVGATVGDAMERLAVEHPAAAALLPTTMTAVNQEYVERSHALRSGDELALIPPVSGGAPDGDVVDAADPFAGRIIITEDPLDAAAVTSLVTSAANGAVVTFHGVTREQTGGRPVVRLEYEGYVEMAHKTLRQIFGEAAERYGVSDLALAHRLGRLELGEPSLILAAAAPHRAEAFAAAMYIVDRLKEIVPIWKKEHFEDGAVWVAQGSAAPPPEWTGSGG